MFAPITCLSDNKLVPKRPENSAATKAHLQQAVIYANERGGHAPVPPFRTGFPWRDPAQRRLATGIMSTNRFFFFKWQPAAVQKDSTERMLGSFSLCSNDGELSRCRRQLVSVRFPSRRRVAWRVYLPDDHQISAHRSTQEPPSPAPRCRERANALSSKPRRLTLIRK